MELSVALLIKCVLIFLARIGDVSLGTLRTVVVMQGRRGLSWLLGFFEVLIWVFAVSAVISNLNHPLLAISYALGFATGNYVGLTIEQWWAPGRQVVRVFSRIGREMAERLRADGYGVTLFTGEGRDGPVNSLYIQTARRGADALTDLAREIDPACFYVVEDVREASTARLASQQRGMGWRGWLQRK